MNLRLTSRAEFQSSCIAQPRLWVTILSRMTALYISGIETPTALSIDKRVAFCRFLRNRMLLDTCKHSAVAFKSHGHNHLSGGMKRTNNWKNDIELTEDFQVVRHFMSNVPGWST